MVGTDEGGGGGGGGEDNVEVVGRDPAEGVGYEKLDGWTTDDVPPIPSDDGALNAFV